MVLLQLGHFAILLIFGLVFQFTAAKAEISRLIFSVFGTSLKFSTLAVSTTCTP